MFRVVILVWFAVSLSSAFVPNGIMSRRLQSLTPVGASVAEASFQNKNERTKKYTWIKESLKKALRKPSTSYKSSSNISGLAEVDPSLTISSPKLESIVKDNRIVVEAPIQKQTTFKVTDFRKRRVSLPKSKFLRERMARKYANIESVEERAFQILVDLKMVELHK